MSTRSTLLGRLAVHVKWISPDQLAEATEEQTRRGGTVLLGDIFVEKGWITAAQLQRLLAKQRDLVAKQRAAQAVAQAAPAPEPGAAQEEARTAASRAPAGASPASARADASAPPGATPPSPVPAATVSAAAAQPTAPRPAAAGGAPDLAALLRQCVERGASDLHLHGGASTRLRRNGALEEADAPALDAERVAALVHASMTEAQRQAFAAAGELDYAYTAPGIGRFRVNAYRQQRGIDAVFRSIPATPPTLASLGLPSALARFTNYHQGMVLVTGPSNCGKSATLSALLDIINTEKRSHILTVEDPIETLHPSKRCVVNQRQVGPHTGSFARALRAALREDPDVIAIGELRDRETIALALTAAETGHFVLATLHTDSAIRTLNRLVGVFPPDQQDQVRTMISESLRAVVSQRLVPTSDGARRVPALEILQVTKAVGNLIRENKTFQIHSILQTGGSHGMQLLDASLAELVRSGTIRREDALLHAEDPKRVPAGGAK